MLDLYEQLEDDAVDPAFTGRSIAEICRDLGVQPDWSRWDGEDWASEIIGASTVDAADPPQHRKAGLPQGNAPDGPRRRQYPAAILGPVRSGSGRETGRNIPRQ